MDGFPNFYTNYMIAIRQQYSDSLYKNNVYMTHNFTIISSQVNTCVHMYHQFLRTLFT